MDHRVQKNWNLCRPSLAWRRPGTLCLVFMVLITTMVGCDFSQPKPAVEKSQSALQEQRPDSPANDVKPVITGDKSARPGDRVSRTISGGQGAPARGNLYYRPTLGASDIQFSGAQPIGYNPATQEYIFDGADIEIIASYTLDDSSKSGFWIDSIRADYGDSAETAWFLTEDLSWVPPLAAAPAAVPLHRAAPQDDYWYWHTLQGFMSPGITVTQGLADDILTPWQGEGLFYAMQVPVPPSPPDESQLLPVVFQGDITPTLRLVEMAPGEPAYVTAPIEYRLDRLPFLEGSSPTGEGEMWVPLGLSSEPLIYPTQPFTLTDWEFQLDVTLDLGGAPEAVLRAAMQEAALEMYYCFEDSQQDAAAPLVRHALGADPAVAFAQGGITCLGPQVLPLASAPTLQVVPAAILEVTPTQSISINHVVVANQPVTVTLDISSTLDPPWGIYRQPDLTDPIVPGATPIKVTGAVSFWIAGTIPYGTAEGGYDLVVTATPVDPPGSARWVRDILWVGVWQPPAASEQHRIYLPLAVRKAP